MKLDDKNIDQLFNDAAQQEKAPAFSPTYWAEMSGMLQARTARKRKLFVWIFAGALACLLLIAGLVMMNQESIPVRYAQNNVGASPLKANKVQSNKNHAATSSQTVKNSDAQESTNEKSSTSSYGDKNNVTAPSSKGNSASSTVPQKMQLATQENQGVKHTFVKENNTDSKKNVLTNKNQEKPSHLSAKDELATTSPTTHQNKNLVNKTDKSRTNAFQLSPLSRHTVAGIPSSHVGDISIVKLKNASPVRYRLYAQLGGGLMENYKTKSPFQSGSFDLKIGFETELHHLLIRTGIGSQVTTNADLIVSKRTKVQTFKVVEYQSDLSYQEMVDLYVPLELGYQFKKVSFGVGVQENYLLTSKMRASYYTDHVLTSTKDLYGNTDGLHRFTTQGYVWATYRFCPLFSIGAKVGTNLTTRIKKGKYFNHSAATNPLYGQLTLRFDFLK